MNKMKRLIIGAGAAAVMLGSMVTPALAGSLLLGRETNPPPTNPPDVLEKECESTTDNGDAVTYPGVSGLRTFESENCT